MKNNDNLFSSTGYYVIGSFLDRIVPFIVLPIIRNKVSLEEYGLFALVLLLSTWTDKLIASPMANSLNRYYHIDDRKNAKNVMFSQCLLRFLRFFVVFAYQIMTKPSPMVCPD